MRERRPPRVDEDDAHLEDLGARVAPEPRGLQVDDGQGTRGPDELLQSSRLGE